jgi:hypothetical protein
LTEVARSSLGLGPIKMLGPVEHVEQPQAHRK